MRHSTNSKYEIMKAALKQFSEKGYYQAGIRDIANDAGVSLGLVNHYFESKKMLASDVISFFWHISNAWSRQYADADTEPILLDAVSTRGMNRLMTQTSYRRFYIESLQEDIFFQGSFKGWGVVPLKPFEKEIEVSDQDMIVLYTRILPYEAEKTLILKKEEGMFKNIPYDDIPLYICLISGERAVPAQEIRKADAEARLIVDEHFSALIDMLNSDVIARFVEEKL